MIKEHSFGIIPLKKEDEHWYAFLILHKAGNYWSFPKGHEDATDRLPQDVAQRELREETGLSVTDFLPLNVLSECYQFERDGKKIEKTVEYFPALVEGVFAPQEGEVLDGKWVPFEEVAETITYEDSRNVWRELIKQFVLSGGM